MENAVKINTAIVIKSTVEKAWDVLFTRFGDTFLYNPNLVGSHFTKSGTGEVGCERECRLDAKTHIRETIIKAETFKGFTLDVTGGNMPMVKRMQVGIRLVSLGSGNIKIIADAAIATKPSFMGFLLKGMFRKKFIDMLVGLKYHLETGEAVTKQTYKVIYSNYKKLKADQPFS